MQLKPLRSLQGPIRVLFVCHGNICRSPMAEYVLKDMVAKRGLEDAFFIDSAATSTEELGNGVHHGTRRALLAHGVPCGDHRARQVGRADAGAWDVIVGMDSYNMRNLQRMLPGDVERMHLLLEFAGRTRNVADPWYTGDFETTYNDVADGCEGLLHYLGF
ncbi:MAG: low molecular weight protein-tyrosine-phosphatase [Coriobacteriia bacterium]|nr:low molecular weight protein-tyrosine-phosphatase [Coriobacteriia bacterium]